MDGTKFNDIGIASELDIPRIQKLLGIGLFSSILVFIGDWLLGYGVEDTSLEGIERMLSSYASISDSAIFWSALLGMIGIIFEGLSYFGIYRLIVSKSPSYAHNLRTGIFGYTIFGPGVHVLCLSSVFLYKYFLETNPSSALTICYRFALFFLVPVMILFMLSFILLYVVQIKAFAKGLTPLPRWACIFSTPIGMLFALPFSFFSCIGWCNALSAAWISVGNIWMFVGLLILTRKLKNSDFAGENAEN